MSLESLLKDLGLQHRDPHSLEEQLKSMRRDVRRLTATLSSGAHRRTDDLGDQLSDFAHDAWQQGSHLAELTGKRARQGVEFARRDPLPIIAVVGTGLLLARLLRRR